MLLLSELLGRSVLDANQRAVGRLDDLVVQLEPAPRVVRLRIRPRVVRLRIRPRRVPAADIAWRSVAAVGESEIRLTGGVELGPSRLDEHELLLGRHVLDARIIDVAGKCLTRVGDLALVLDDGSLDVAAVEVGARPVLRRLGLGYLARRSRSTFLEWKDLHLVSHRGRGVQLAATGRGTGAAPSHSKLVDRLAPDARRRRFRLRWIRRRAPT